MSEPVFLRDGERFVPTGHGRGPWDAGALHGGAPAALVAEVLQRAEPAGGMAVVRVTYEFLSAVPLAPLQVQARVVRPGRRLQLVEAELSAGDAVVLRARAVRLRRGALELPAGAREEPGLPCEPPGAIEPTALASTASGASEGFGLTGMELRFAGSTDFGPGPALAWFRLGRPLVEGEEPSPLARVVAAADFGNGISYVLDWESGCSSTPTSPCTCTASQPASGSCSTPARTSRRPAPGSPSRGCSTSTGRSACRRSRCSSTAVSARGRDAGRA